MDWQKFRAGLQNATAGPPEPNGKTIGQKAAQRVHPSAVAWVKFGSWEVARVLWRKHVYFIFQNPKPPLFGGQAENGDLLDIKGSRRRYFTVFQFLKSAFFVWNINEYWRV